MFFPANESCSALETYPWIVRTHPSPLPHQLLSLPRPQPDCRAPNKGLQKHRKRGKPKVREGVQKPQRNNSKQLEHHLRHQCPTGSVKRDSGRFPLLLLPFDFNTSLTSWRKFKALHYYLWQKKMSLNMVFMFQEREWQQSPWQHPSPLSTSWYSRPFSWHYRAPLSFSTDCSCRL